MSARAMPSLSVLRRQTGEVRRVPWGVQRALSWDDLGAIDGCFRTCYDSSSLSRTASVSTTGSVSNSALQTSCAGEWVFWGITNVNSTVASSNFVLGAFVKQMQSFRSSVNFTDVTVNQTTVHGQENNGLFWYHLPGHSMGFSTESIMALQSRYGFVNLGTNTSCHDSMSWSMQTVASDDVKSGASDPGHGWMAADCVLRNNGWYRLVAMTNTCPLLLPPAFRADY